MFDALTDRFDGIFQRLRGRGRLSDADVDEVLREIRVALLEADVNLTVVRNLIDRIRERCVGEQLSQSLSPAQQVIKIVHEELIETLGGETMKITFASKPPTVILMAGLQGSGKTTNSAKLARWFHMTAVDRAGLGHLFRIDAAGRLLADLKLGEGAIFHPGGIDYDGTSIWVSVAEYKPDSRTIVYRVDPKAMKATEVFRFDDHIGAIVHNTDDNTLHGVSWGSRRFYRWTLGRDGRVTNAGVPPAVLRRLNRSHYVDYQDCKYAGRRRMICTGVTEIRQVPGAAPFRLGGIEIVNLGDGRAEYQVPVNLWTASGLVMTQNPAWIEPHGDGLRAYFVPEDDKATLYIYDVK